MTLQDRSLSRRAVLAAAALALLFIALHFSTWRYPAAQFPHGLTDPVLAVELAASPDDIGALFAIPGSEQLDLRGMLIWNTLLDLPFIAAYAAFFWFAAGSLARSELATPIRALTLLMALADLIEDAGIFRALRGTGWAPWTRQASLAKWAAFALILFLLSAQLFKTRLRPFDRTISAALTLAVFFAAITAATGLLDAPALPFGGLFSYSHLNLAVSLFALLPLSALAGAILARRGLSMDDARPFVPPAPSPREDAHP